MPAKGEGRVERAIREHLAAHPDKAFNTDDLCTAFYPASDWGPGWVHRSQRVAVLRAADNVLTADPDWYRTRCGRRGGMAVFVNAASVKSEAMADRLSFYGSADRDWIAEKAREMLEKNPEERKRLERKVSQHIAERGAATAEERERLIARHRREHNARIVALLTGTGVRPLTQFLDDGAAPATAASVVETPPAPLDNTNSSLAAKARALMTQNDSDAVRTGLAEIADALARMLMP
jgi:hypothetical protein